MKIVLVRHGQTAANRAHALDTARPGLPLTEEGLSQAARRLRLWHANTVSSRSSDRGFVSCVRVISR